MTTPLHEAIAMNDLEEVEYLLHTPGTEVDAVGEQGTPLCYAACTNHIEAAELLIAAGADVNWTSTTWSCPVPLEVAALAGHKEMAILLLDSGADIELSSSLLSPLYCACSAAHRDLIAIFIKRGADVKGPLQLAAYHDNADIIPILLDSGAAVDGRGNDREYGDLTPLYIAVSMGNRICVRALLAAKADPNLEGCHGNLIDWTVLNSSIRNLDTAPGIIEDLLSHGANILYRNKTTGRTALTELEYHYMKGANDHIHIRNKYCQIAAILVAAGDRNWDCVPVPCPGIERALLPVWREALEELAEVYKRLGEELKSALQAVIYGIHKRLPVGLREMMMGVVLDVWTLRNDGHGHDRSFMNIPYKS